jgi:phage terminase small subunit
MAKLQVIDAGKTLGDPDAAPTGLGAEGRRLWVQITTEWEITDAASATLLTMACRQADRAEECAQRLAKDGPVLKTRAGVKAHPLIQAEIACRSFVARALSKLGVLFEPQKMIGRPPGT